MWTPWPSQRSAKHTRPTQINSEGVAVISVVMVKNLHGNDLVAGTVLLPRPPAALRAVGHVLRPSIVGVHGLASPGYVLVADLEGLHDRTLAGACAFVNPGR